MQSASYGVLSLGALQALIDLLKARDYRVLGPRIREQAIIYAEIDAIDELPKGWTDSQDGGHYRLKRRDDAALFGYAVGPHSWKKFLHEPVIRLWQARRDGDRADIAGGETEPHGPFAFIGVRACEPTRLPSKIECS